MRVYYQISLQKDERDSLIARFKNLARIMTEKQRCPRITITMIVRAFLYDGLQRFESTGGLGLKVEKYRHNRKESSTDE